jgi:hypothetical protein
MEPYRDLAEWLHAAVHFQGGNAAWRSSEGRGEGVRGIDTQRIHLEKVGF